MDAAEFLSRLFGDAVCEDREVVVWSKGSGARWCSTVAAATDALARLGASSDTYFGVALQSWRLVEERADRLKLQRPSRDSTRGFAETTVAVGGLWLDVDVAGGAHGKERLPPTIAAAREVVSGLHAEPSVVLETGGGLHAWWLLREPWCFDGEAERKKAAQLSHAWQLFAKRVAGVRGWSVDMTHDLSRVLRAPGTTNHKYGRAVTVLSVSVSAAYNQSDFEAWVPQDAASEAGSDARRHEELTVNVVDGIALDPTAEPPVNKLMALIDLDARFEKTWKRRRTDLPSQSEYDMAIASACVDAGWSDQEVVNALIAHRRDGPSREKLRLGYYRGLLAKIRRSRRANDAQDRLVEIDAAAVERPSPGAAPAVNGAVVDSSETPPAGAQQPGAPARVHEKDQRDALLRDVSEAVGTDVIGVVKTLSEPPRYRLLLPGGTSVDLGTVEGLTTFRRFHLSLASATGLLLDPVKPARWRPIARALLRCVEVHDLGTHSSNALTACELVEGFLRDKPPADGVAEGVAGRASFVGPGGHTYVRLRDLARWARYEGDVPSSRELARWLREAGCVPKVLNYVRDTDGARTTTSAWMLPQSLLRSSARAEPD